MLCPAHFGIFDRAIMHSGTRATLPAAHVLTDAVAGRDHTALSGFQLCYDPNHKNTTLPSKVPIQVLCQDPNAYDLTLQSVFIGVNKDEGTAFATSIQWPCNLRTSPDFLQKFVPLPKLTSLFESEFQKMLPPETDPDVFQILAKYMGENLT
ncbi:hypothetical protein MVEG_00133 [Podila verticillata NRRL 6337]|nr:hypothetical protein MVEG_00133 [Podila verticillata NRRL 6337]